jgi:hypothetical protein
MGKLPKMSMSDMRKAERIAKATRTSPADVVRIKYILPLFLLNNCGIPSRFYGVVAKILKLPQMLTGRVKLLGL